MKFERRYYALQQMSYNNNNNSYTWNVKGAHKLIFQYPLSWFTRNFELVHTFWWILLQQWECGSSPTFSFSFLFSRRIYFLLGWNGRKKFFFVLFDTMTVILACKSECMNKKRSSEKRRKHCIKKDHFHSVKNSTNLQSTEPFSLFVLHPVRLFLWAIH